HQVDLVWSADKIFLVFGWHGLTDHFLNRLHQFFAFYLFQVLLKAPESHVREVFAPLEIRDSNTARIEENVGNYQDSAGMEPLFSPGGRGTISRFRQHFAIDAITIFEGDLIFEGGRNQYVTGDIPDRIGRRQSLGTREILDRAGVLTEVIQFF